ncbi:MAG: sugar ABC transporter permease [bacterium]|nr:sugar ABC transporter permease [bacterium]MDT8394822.1 sugar ABC transporter permease [bacterium]
MALEGSQTQVRLPDRLQVYLPRIVLSPTIAAAVVFIYGFILWTAWISLTNSGLLPRYELAGFIQYTKLFASDRWWVASRNLGIFGGLFVLFCTSLGLLLAILLDQKIRVEGALRTIYLYPMALSFIVTGTAWRWMLNPGLGLERVVRQMGFETFTFDWLVNSKMSIYTVVIAGVWQSTGFVMALFLAGLRSIDDSIIRAAQVDGASLPRIYLRIIIPSMRPVFFSAMIILSHIAIKSFDLVMVLTRGGPGYSSDLPATFMYTFAFTRNRLAFGAASAMMMFMAVMAIIVPYLYSELRVKRDG